MFEDYYALIMAGGGGTRLWPVSRRSRPKQMIRFFDEDSMFQTSVRRLEGLFPPERILVITVADQANELKRHSPQIPEENFILEPSPRGTASAIGLASVVLARRVPDAVLAVLTSDHFIKNEAFFLDLLSTSYAVARDNFLVTLGIKPTFPSTGYGYIHYGNSLGDREGKAVFRVAGFREKPDQATARQFLSSGEYAWNSGMFIMRVDSYLNEVSRQMPELDRGLKEIVLSIGTPDESAKRSLIWESLKPQTIDYGIMEGAEQVAVIPGEGLGWNDVGSWDSLFETLPADENGNIFVNSDSLSLDTSNTLVFDGARERLIVTIGIDDLVIVETSDVLLVCRKGHGQNVRSVVEKLKRSGREDIL